MRLPLLLQFMPKHGCSRDIKGELLVMYGLFTKASHRNVWCVRVLLDTEIDSAAYIPRESQQGKEISSHPKTSRPDLGLTQPSIHRYRGSFPGAKWSERERGLPNFI
jgi:hypothetical protein